MAFNVPISSSPPLPTPIDWVRPSDWPVITDAPNEVQFLVCDIGAKAFTIQTTFSRTSGNIYIDWGDGVTDTISTTTTVNTSHVYSTGGTPCSRGYNTWKVRIYGDASCVITNARHLSNFAATGGNLLYSVGVLEAYYGDNTCNTSVNSGRYFTSTGAVNSGNAAFNYLEYVKLPATVNWTSQFQYMFAGCSSLYKVVMPTSASGINTFLATFQNCSQLLDIVIPSNSTGATLIQNTFQNCTNLRTISLPSALNSCTNMANMCQGCFSLKNITVPSINLVTDMSNAFSTCYSLQWIKFISLPSPASLTAITAVSLLANCRSLQNVDLPSSCSSNANFNFSTAFIACRLLKGIQFPNGFTASSLNATFTNCYDLTYIGFPSTMSTLSNLSGAFNGCWSLPSVSLPTTVSSSTTMTLQNAFANCTSLTSITIPSSYNINNLNGTFNECQKLESIVLPNNAQNSCTTMAIMAQNCYNLKSIVMPTSLNGVTTLQAAFSGCNSLTSVSFPATMNSCTTMQSIFVNCYELTSVTLPTSMTGCTNFVAMFSACRSIRSITMPSTVALLTTAFANAFTNCYSLSTLTLPTTQTSSVNTINQMILGCSSLTTINNLNKIGSLTATPLVNGLMGTSNTAATSASMLTSLSFSCPFSGLNLNGSSATEFNKLNSLRLLNTGANQWTLSAPHINVSYCDLGVSALNQLFTDLTTISGKTINITGCTGAAGCTRSIATAKGWTVTG
jgi:hypothetical protein